MHAITHATGRDPKINDAPGPQSVLGNLIIVRHGESEGNARNVFTGLIDLPLTDRGRFEAREVGLRLMQAGIMIDVAFSSRLKRAAVSAQIILDASASPASLLRDEHLNERDYGDLSGLNKRDVIARFGAAQVHSWRRSLRARPPNGETLAEVVDRVRRFVSNALEPRLARGGNCLIVAHGNSCRALLLALNIEQADKIEGVEFKTGMARCFHVMSVDDSIRYIERSDTSARYSKA